MSANTTTIRTMNWRPTTSAVIVLAAVVVLGALLVVLAPRAAQTDASSASGEFSSIITDELSQGERFLNGSSYRHLSAIAAKRSVTDRMKEESKYGGDVSLPIQWELVADRFMQESKYGGDVPLVIKRDPSADRLKQESKYGG